jgi:hypothetical protein
MPITEDRATGGNGNIVTVLLLAVVMLKARDHPTTVHLKRQPGTATPQDQILRYPAATGVGVPTTSSTALKRTRRTPDAHVAWSNQ